ncbi:MAG: hypothetical protein P4N59_17360 [Negativicutes bacterium]|nr:hypothetical protein [Negativicutes bacterium]
MSKTKSQSFASEYAMSAGDNAVSRKQIDASIVSTAMANEHSFRQACMGDLTDGSQQKAIEPESADGRPVTAPKVSPSERSKAK